MLRDAQQWKLSVHSTSDVSLEVLEHLGRELAPEVDLHVVRLQAFYKSAEPPSWIAFLTEASWWAKGIAAYAALFVAELVKEAAKDAWKQRGRLAAKMGDALGPIRTLAEKLAALRESITDRTNVVLGLPFPDDHFATRLPLEGTRKDEIAAELALFVHYLPALDELIHAEALSSRTVTAGIHLRLCSDLSLEVSWMDTKSRTVTRRVLRFSSEVVVHHEE